jgi:hypothetical protein
MGTGMERNDAQDKTTRRGDDECAPTEFLLVSTSMGEQLP